MNPRLPFLLAALVLCGAPALSAKSKPDKASSSSRSVSQDEAVRLQLFLDEHDFGPGKIDGNYGGFTKKSWQYYQQAQGETPKDTFDVKAPPLATETPLYTTYTVTAQDVSSVSPLPPKLVDQAKGTAMPYASVGEMLGERYHSAVGFLAHLNPGKNLDQLKEGDQVTVPNVARPFDLAAVVAKRQATLDQAKVTSEAAHKGSKSSGKTAKDSPSPSPLPDGAATNPGAPVAGGDATPPPGDPAKMMIHVSVKDAYLEVHADDKIVAGFPITPGSTAIPSPKGEWKIESKTLLPLFRWDKSMLLYGKRSGEFYNIPPGPNNPVGIAWIALNKPGIGLHGTNDPETIGRAASHGCIRLANWDAFKLFGMVRKGEKVVIE